MLTLRYLISSFAFVFGLIWALVGTVFVGAGAAWLYSEFQLHKHGVHTRAVLVEKHHETGRERSSRYSLKYVFTDTAGQERIESEDVPWETWRQYEDGNQIPIVYLPRRAGSSRIAQTVNARWWWPEILFVAFGSLFAIPGWVLLVRGAMHARRRMRMLRTGVPVTGTITGMDIDRSVRINGRHPSHLLYSFVAPNGDQIVARSLNLPRRMEDKFHVGGEITIICDPIDPRKHEADIYGVRAGQARLR